VKVELIKSVDFPELERLFEEKPPNTFFQSTIWLGALVRAFKNFEPRWIVLRERDNILGAMPYVRVKKTFLYSNWSMPFGTYGGPVVIQDDLNEKVIKEFFKLSSSLLCFKAGVFIFNPSGHYRHYGATGVAREEFCHVVDLGAGFDEYWDRQIRSKRRQLYRKGKRGGVTVREVKTRDEFEAFYSLYLENSKVWGGVHPYPKMLFEELFSIDSADVLFLGGFVNDRELIGGHMIFFSSTMAQAWQAAMSPRAYDFYLGEILIVEAIKITCERGIRYFNLGTSAGKAGIESFKESMGGRKVPVLVLRKKYGL